MDKSFWNKSEMMVISKLQPHLGKTFFPDNDGKIRMKKSLSLNVPWLFNGGRDFGDCYVYHQVYFDIIGIIPSFCQYFCWKIVMKPQTLKDAFELFDAFKRLDYPGKIGMETRAYVKGHYSAYIYNDSYEEGQNRYEIITSEFPHIPAILKKGCTEFEHRVPSNQWGADVQQQEIEKFLMTIFNPDPIPVYQPKWVQNHVKREMIFHAYKIGDETYKDFIPEEDWQLFPKSVEYQQAPGVTAEAEVSCAE